VAGLDSFTIRKSSSDCDLFLDTTVQALDDIGTASEIINSSAAEGSVRLYVRNYPGAQTYFEVHDPDPNRPLGDEAEHGRPVGALYRAVVDPFRLGTLYERASGGLWLDHVGMPGTPQYVNADFAVLREACGRWLAALQVGSGFHEFLRWLHATDPECERREQEYPHTFWGCEFGDIVNPFGPLGEAPDADPGAAADDGGM
jgi:hypothetical protein